MNAPCAPGTPGTPADGRAQRCARLLLCANNGLCRLVFLRTRCTYDYNIDFVRRFKIGGLKNGIDRGYGTPQFNRSLKKVKAIKLGRGPAVELRFVLDGSELSRPVLWSFVRIFEPASLMTRTSAKERKFVALEPSQGHGATCAHS